MSLSDWLNKILPSQTSVQHGGNVSTPALNVPTSQEQTAPIDFFSNAQNSNNTSPDAYNLSNDDEVCLNALNEAMQTQDLQDTQEIDYEQYVIDQFEEDLEIAKEQTQEQLALQDEKDGLVNDIWNGFKELTGVGISKSDVADAIEKQEGALEALKQAKINGNFEEVYEQITGNKFNEEQLMYCHNTEVALEYIQSDLDKILNSNESDETKQAQVEKYLQDYQNETGVGYEQLVSHYQELSNEYLGTANELTNVLNNYVNSQETFIDKAAQVAQIGGMGMMAVGAVACFIPGGQLIGAGMLKAGQMLAMAGTFGDNVAEFIDTATSDRSTQEKKEEYREIAKETVIDVALYGIGRFSGNAGNAIGNVASKFTNSKFLIKSADIATDATISLLGDKAITGEVDLQGEGLSQLLGIVTGSAVSRINNMKVDTPEVKPEAPKAEASNDTTKTSLDSEAGVFDVQKGKTESCAVLDDVATKDNTDTGFKGSEISDNTGNIKNNKVELENRIKEFESYTKEQLTEKMLSEGIKSEMFEVMEMLEFDVEKQASFFEYSKFMPQENAILFARNSTPEMFERVKTLSDIGLEFNDLTIRQITDQYGFNFEKLSDGQLEVIKNLNAQERSDYLYLLTEGFVSSLENMEAKFDTFNYLLNGEVKDVGLVEKMTQIGETFGIEIKIDNDAVYQGSDYKTINDDYIKSLTYGLEQLKKAGAKLPNPIYLTDLMDLRAAGGFCPLNSDSVIMGIMKQFNHDTMHASLLHEVGHMNDFNKEIGRYESAVRFMNLLKTGAVFESPDSGKNIPLGDMQIGKITLPNGLEINANDIGYLIRGYGDTNIKEFTAEVANLVYCEAIVQKDGKWTINPENVPKGYCIGWNPDNAYAVKQLDTIMRLFSYLTNYKYIQQ